MPKTCFLIDDDEDDVEIFSSALQQVDESIECITAGNGIEALEKLTRPGNFVPDYIFLDLNMPLMNGKQFLKEIKKQEGLNHIPVIVYTTSSYQKDMEETRSLGAEAFITKPPFISDLRRILSDIFREERPA